MQPCLVAMQAQVVYALDFSRWKRKPLQQCFPGSRFMFVASTDDVPNDMTLAVWGMKKLPPDLVDRRIEVVRIEDGFLRSVGLGVDLVRPVSWVVDRRGIYFDSSRPSDLEVLLTETNFDHVLITRAAALRERIVASGLTKYNIGTTAWRRPRGVSKVILVPGQVETDASIIYGAPVIKSNLALLRAVRLANPDGYVIYKPHPDVVAGLRARGKGEEEVAHWCNEILVDAQMGALLNEVDEVHVLTSLTGFEALLRGKRVTCYGHPFYAGWGLTNDITPIDRRQRRLQLDELVAGALILYPRYMSRKRDALITPEEAIDELLEWRNRYGGKTPWWRNLFRPILRRVVGVR